MSVHVSSLAARRSTPSSARECVLWFYDRNRSPKNADSDAYIQLSAINDTNVWFREAATSASGTKLPYGLRPPANAGESCPPAHSGERESTQRIPKSRSGVMEYYLAVSTQIRTLAPCMSPKYSML